MAFIVLDSFGDVTGTEWGQTLLLKSAAVAVAVAIGAYNHFRLVPALDAEPESPRRSPIASALDRRRRGNRPALRGDRHRIPRRRRHRLTPGERPALPARTGWPGLQCGEVVQN